MNQLFIITYSYEVLDGRSADFLDGQPTTLAEIAVEAATLRAAQAEAYRFMPAVLQEYTHGETTGELTADDVDITVKLHEDSVKPLLEEAERLRGILSDISGD